MSSKFRPLTLPGAIPSQQQAYDELCAIDLRYECDKTRVYRRRLNLIDIVSRTGSQFPSLEVKAKAIREMLNAIQNRIYLLLDVVIKYAQSTGTSSLQESLDELIKEKTIDSNGFLNLLERGCELSLSDIEDFRNAIGECDSCMRAEYLVNALREITSLLTPECRRYYGGEWTEMCTRLDSKYKELIAQQTKMIRDLTNLKSRVSSTSTSTYNVVAFDDLRQKMDARKYELLFGLVDSNTMFSPYQKGIIDDCIDKMLRYLNSGLDYHATRHTEAVESTYV